MSHLTRRKFVGMVGAAGAATSVLSWPILAQAGKDGGRVVIVGGGFGGESLSLRRAFSPCPNQRF